jgi:hypothetical protein
MVQTTAPTLSCRDVTAEDIAHYAEHGWAKLEGLLDPASTAALLAMAQAKLGMDGQGNPVSPYQQPFFNPEMTGGPDNPILRPLLDGIGRMATALQQRRPGLGVRYYSDVFAAKLPSAKPTNHPGAGTTYFHQDYQNWAVDRSGGMTFWIALEDIAPESGTMSFFNGSHRLGALGHYRSYDPGKDIRDDFPELDANCPLTGPIRYRAGDATVHHNLTVHGGGRNQTERPRWAYLAIVNPADVRWTGAPPEAFDTTGMTPLQPLTDTRFPLLG